MAKKSKQTYKVFVVDDDSKYLLLFKNHLETNSNFILDISIFDTGDSLMENLPKHPDVIVLDHYLNSANPNAKLGMEYLKEIKEKYPEIPVVMMSGQGDLQLVVDMFEEGATDYIIKNETSFLRGLIIVDNEINKLEQIQFAKDQKRIQYALIFLVVLLVGVTVSVATFMN